ISASACSRSSRAVGTSVSSRPVVLAHVVATLAIEAKARASGEQIVLAGADDFGETLEAAEKGRWLRMQVDENGRRPGVIEGLVDPDRRLGRDRTFHPAMRQKRQRRIEPQQAIERAGRFRVGCEHADVAVHPPGLGDELRDKLQRLADIRVEIDRRHAIRRFQPIASCDSSQVASIGTGRPVAPFSLPSFHAIPAMSRCAQSYLWAKRDRKHAAVMLPPARPAMLATSAKLLASPSW